MISRAPSSEYRDHSIGLYLYAKHDEMKKGIFLMILRKGFRREFHQITVSLVAFLSVPMVSWSACMGSSPTWSSTPDRTSVARCVSRAKNGDTIKVAPGNAIWDKGISFTKSISIIGAGIGNTIITVRGTDAFSMTPKTNSYLTRISGFTFNLDNHQGVHCDNNRSLPPKYKIRIDHNRFTNSNVGGAAVESWDCRGVIDNNIIDNIRYPFRVGWGTGGGAWNWQNLPDLVYGAANDNMYVEDNIISGVSTCVENSGEGGRYAFRYNTITPATDMYPLFDIHNWQSPGDWSSMGAEVYGNRVNFGGHTGFVMSWRGGRLNYMFNDFATTARSPLIHLYNNNGSCPSTDRTRQLHNNGIMLNNRINATGALLSVDVGRQDCGPIIEDVAYWKSNPSCMTPDTCSHITTGIGCGTLANLPADCTNGTLYWATDQSCSDLNNLTGDIQTYSNRQTIEGRMYRCESGAMVPYFSLLPYPHPLRIESSTIVRPPSTDSRAQWINDR